MTDQLLTPTQAFERWIKGEPVECLKGSGYPWNPLNRDHVVREAWQTFQFRIPPQPLTFVEACEKAAEKSASTGLTVLIASQDARAIVSSRGEFWVPPAARNLTVADLRRTDWRVE